MSADPIDELGERLFDVARQERPPSGAPERVMDAIRSDRAASKDTTRAATWMLVGPLAVAAAAVLWLSHREEPVTPISAEPSAAAHSVDEKPAPQITPPAVSATEHAVTAPAPSSRAPAPARSAATTLADEIEMLKQAEGALGAGDTKHALQALDRYDRVVKNQQMRAEATLLRIEALSRSGRPDAAATLARRFVEKNPGSPLVDRARSFLAKDVNAAGGQPQE